MYRICLTRLTTALAIGAAATLALGATVQEKNDAIDAGVAYLLSQQQANGSWLGQGAAYADSGTGAVLLALAEEELFRQEQGLANAGAFNAQLEAGLKYLLGSVDVYTGANLHTQQQGDADVNANNRALYWGPTEQYQGGFVVPAIVRAAQALNITTVDVPGSPVDGESIATVVQDAADWLAYAQNDVNNQYRGGWRYAANDGSSDNSVSQFPAIALIYAEDYGATVPSWVKTELSLWLDYIQGPNGGSGYTNPGEEFSHTDWLGRAGGLIVQNAFVADTVAGRADEIAQALAFINTHWQQPTNVPAITQENSAYTMWAAYKGLEVAVGIYDTSPINNLRWNYPHSGGNFDDPNHDVWNWWEDYCEYLVETQEANGSWDGVGSVTHLNMVSAVSLNILRGAEVPEEFDEDLIPEPGTLAGAMLGMAALTMALRRRRAG
jgi:hypothetical protein